jgi:ABC-2 type transport system permease protein
MPIYEQSYRRREARGPLRQVRSWPIAREALRLLFARRLFLLLMALTWAPLIGWSLYVYFMAQAPDIRRVLPLDAKVFAEFMYWQAWLALFPTLLGGSGMIAGDLRTGAILIYLSRPLTRVDYVLGKLGALLALNLGVTLLPGLLLYGIALALAPDVLLQWSMARIGPAVVVDAVVVSLVFSLLALALSSLSRSARVAGMAFFGVVVALSPVAALLKALTDSPLVSLLSLWEDLATVGQALFGLPPDPLRPAWPYPALVLLATLLVSLAVLRARVRAVEVVR